MFNQYGVILVNPKKHANVKAAEGQAFVDWLIGPEGQAAIAAYKRNGEQRSGLEAELTGMRSAFAGSGWSRAGNVPQQQQRRTAGCGFSCLPPWRLS